MNEIIDFHIHYLPQSVSAEKMLSAMDAAGVAKAVVLATPNHPRYLNCSLTGGNPEVLELAAAYPERFIPAVYIEPRNVMEAQTALHEYHARGVRLVKMWPGHGFSPDDPMIYPVWETMNRLKMGVILHSGSLGNRPSLGVDLSRMSGFNAKFGQPFLLDQPARFFPDVTFIIAHAAYPWTQEALEMAFMFENIYMDFSCGLGYEAQNLIAHIHPLRMPWKKMLFGTDTAGLPESFVTRWTELMQDPFFAPHAREFFHDNAAELLRKLFCPDGQKKEENA